MPRASADTCCSRAGPLSALRAGSEASPAHAVHPCQNTGDLGLLMTAVGVMLHNNPVWCATINLPLAYCPVR